MYDFNMDVFDVYILCFVVVGYVIVIFMFVRCSIVNFIDNIIVLIDMVNVGL